MSRRLPTVLFIAAVASCRAGAAEPAERVGLFGPGVEGMRLSVWNMKHELRAGRLRLNGDHQAAPWAGVVFQPTKKGRTALAVSKAWLAGGCVRLRVNAFADAYGQERPPCEFQVRLLGCMDRYRRVPARFYEGGAGIDLDAATWQEVLVPLALLGVKAGTSAAGLGVQCVGRPESAFGLAEVALVRFETLPARLARGKDADVAQPWVTWPGYDELPPALRPPAAAPLWRDGKLVTSDGRRAFLVMPWGREDQKLALGIHGDGQPPPHFGLYDPGAQGFVYAQPLAEQSLARLGFNVYAGQVHPGAFWRAVGYADPHAGRFTDDDFRRHVRGLGRYPCYVDMVCFPWTLGKPAAALKDKLPAGVGHDGDRHWTPYRIIGPGRETWLTMWRTYARRYKEAGARVIFYELFNEPAYAATTDDHRAEFVAWLKKRYGTVARVRAAWGATCDSWDAVRRFKSPRDCAGLFFDYDEYLGDRFADLVRAGCRTLEAVTPGLPAAVQTMGGYVLQPRDGVYPSKLIPAQRAVITPTGGGRWTRGSASPRPGLDTIDCPIGPSPLSHDLQLAMAGGKMLVNNEMYLGPGQTRRGMRNRWWKEVLAGVDGAAWFSWSKRGWAWRQGKQRIAREADQFPYSGLIPYARRADAIRGVLEFAREMDLVREYVLPKPWGPKARVAMIYSWADARRRVWDSTARSRTGHVHAAMRYLHWTFDVVPSHLAGAERLRRYKLLVLGGADWIEPDLLARLTEFVRAGGVLLAVDSPMRADLYGRPVDPAPLLGVKIKARAAVPPGTFRIDLPKDARFSGGIRAAAGLLALEIVPPTWAMLNDASGRAVVTRHALGEGAVYFIAADVRGYPLGRLLAEVRRRVLDPPNLSLTDATTGRLATNVLVSRRSHAAHHALLLWNADPFPKLLTVRLRGLAGAWVACDPLEGKALAFSQGAVAYCLKGDDFGLVLLTRGPWRKTKLLPADAATMKARYEKEIASWKAAQ